MATTNFISLISMLCISFVIALQYKPSLAVETTKPSTLQNYIVHVKHPEGRVLSQSEDFESWHKSFLPATISSSDNQPRLIYSYQNVISGFAARLTEEDVRAMKNTDAFIAARPERMLKLHTTRTPTFLGLQQQTGFWRESNFGEGVIIGILDGGILPSHPSFSDSGMPPPPPKWNGKCEFNMSECNNKIIGARSFNLAAKARKPLPRIDKDGHGTHMAGIAAGGLVKNADALGNAKGTAAGMAPYYHDLNFSSSDRAALSTFRCTKPAFPKRILQRD